MIKLNVEINKNSWKKKIQNPKIYFNKKLKKINNYVNFFKNNNVSFTIFLTSSFHMKKLNKKFRKLNKATDVLSFPNFSSKNLKSFKNEEIYIGDIAISYEIINSRSKKNNFHLEFSPILVKNILICVLVAFCASSSIANEFFKVRPLIKASGAISISPDSIFFCILS